MPARSSRGFSRVTSNFDCARFGSPLDSMLTLYDADGRVVAANDDADGTADSRVEATLPRAGAYYISVVDANDVGSAANVYRLVIRAK